MSQYLGNVLPLIDSLLCDVQDKVHIMGYGTARGRDVIQNGRQNGRHLGFHLKLKLNGETRKLLIYFARVVIFDTIVV